LERATHQRRWIGRMRQAEHVAELVQRYGEQVVFGAGARVGRVGADVPAGARGVGVEGDMLALRGAEQAAGKVGNARDEIVEGRVDRSARLLPQLDRLL